VDTRRTLAISRSVLSSSRRIPARADRSTGPEYEGGGQEIRFCYYSLDGRFQRSPMMVDSEDSPKGLRAALKSTPRLRALIKNLGS
jgi:hypothetical protein